MVREPKPSNAGGVWPFLPIPVVIVVALSLITAISVSAVGFFHLGQASDRAVRSHVSVVGEVLAARLRVTPKEEQTEVVMRASQQADGLEMLVIERGTTILANSMSRTPEVDTLQHLVRSHEGEIQGSAGRTFYRTVPYRNEAEERDERVLIVFGPAPLRPESASALLAALVALTVLLLLVAAFVAYSVAYDSLRDILYVTDRILAMTRVSTEPAGEAIAARTGDEVGAVTIAFNALHARFEQAEARYRADLQRARVQDENRSKFLAAVSHELRTPLNAILGFADVLLNEVDGPLTVSAREDVVQIRESGQNLAHLVNDIVEFSALEGGQLKLDARRMDLLQVATEVVRESQVLVRDKPVLLTLVGEESLYIRADVARVRQILSNLVGNAIKFTKQGEVRVKVWIDQGMACVSVLDTGPGISEEERAYIFQEYKQTRQETVLARGTGLGLAITRRLVALHGAKLRLASEVGRGSEFRVLFPLEVS